MRRRVSALALGVALCLGAAACGASDNGGTVPVPGGTSSTSGGTGGAGGTSATLHGGG